MERENVDKQPYYIRYTAPNRYDLAPYGTLHRVMNEDNKGKLYIQLSHEEGTAHWEVVGDFLADIFEHFLNQEQFIQECLKLFENKKETTFVSIVSCSDLKK